MKSETLNREFDYSTALIGADEDASGWMHDAWIVEIDGERIEYKTGIGHRKTTYYNGKALRKSTAPAIDDVLYSLVMDASALDCGFEDWCSELGYDTDSRSALKTYLACQESGMTLRKIGVNVAEAAELFQDY